MHMRMGVNGMREHVLILPCGDHWSVCNMPMRMDVNGMKKHVRMRQRVTLWNGCSMHTKMGVHGGKSLYTRAIPAGSFDCFEYACEHGCECDLQMCLIMATQYKQSKFIERIQQLISATQTCGRK